MIKQWMKGMGYFSKAEWTLWGVSVGLILVSFRMFDRENTLTLTASLVGVTSLIFNAKGNPIGQVLMILFSILYGVISFTFSYYGEMITYLGMTAPMAAVALAAWLRNPYQGNRSQVQVNRVRGKEYVLLIVLTAAVTWVFYEVLAFFDTAYLPLSTLSVTTSFVAVYLTFRRSPYYAIGYAANDVILIILWILASAQSRAYVSVAVCFVTFLASDIYGYISWREMERRQRGGESAYAMQACGIVPPPEKK